MNIGIDGRLYNESGNGRYIRNLITHLQKLDSYNRYFVFLLKKDFEEVNLKNNFIKVLADIGWYGFLEQTKFPVLLGRYNLDLVHFPHFNIPLFYRGKYVVTIHDLIHQHFNMQRTTTHGPLIFKLKQLGYKKVFKNALQKSKKILTPSNFVKEQLIKTWKVDDKKIDVTYEAVDDKILKLSRQKFAPEIKSPYIFYVGNAHPHKNVEGLIKVFGRLREKHPHLKLVLSGKDHFFGQRLKREYRQEGIVYTGYVTDARLVGLYKNARCFVLPSLEEGFGIPVLEAMACSCPVVSSSAGSLKEVGGDAALYFDPGDQGDMGDKIDMVLNSGKLREDLIRKGNIRVRQFSWERLAEQTLNVYLKA